MSDKNDKSLEQTHIELHDCSMIKTSYSALKAIHTYKNGATYSTISYNAVVRPKGLVTIRIYLSSIIFTIPILHYNSIGVFITIEDN